MSEIRPYPNLLSPDERMALLKEAEWLWEDLQKNDIGGYSGVNRPFYILHAFKQVIEKYGGRDVGLSWSKNDLDAAIANPPNPNTTEQKSTSSRKAKLLRLRHRRKRAGFWLPDLGFVRPR